MKDVLIAMGNAVGLLVSAGVLILYIYELFTGNIQHLSCWSKRYLDIIISNNNIYSKLQIF